MNHSLKSLQSNEKILSIVKILDATPIALSVKDTRLDYVYYNSRFASLFGMEESVNNDFDLFLPEIAFQLNQEDSNFLTSEVEGEIETPVITKAGLRKLLAISRSVYEENGEQFVISSIRDITSTIQDKHFEAFQKVLSENEIYEKLLNRFSNFIFRSNNDKEILEGVAKLAIDLMQLEDISIYDYSSSRDVLERKVEFMKDQTLEYRETGEDVISFEETDLRWKAVKLGHSVVAGDEKTDATSNSEIAVPIVYKNQLLGIIDSKSSKANYYTPRIKKTLEGIASLLAVKLNELKHYRQLEAKHNDLEALISNHPMPVAMLDTELNYMEVSHAWKAEFVHPAEGDIVGKNHYKVNPNIPLRWKRKITKALKGESQELKKEYYTRKNGKPEWFYAKVSPWYTADHQIGGVILLAELISKRVESEIQLLKTNEELAEARKLGKLFTWSFIPDTGRFHWHTGVLSTAENETQQDQYLDAVYDMIDAEYHEDFSKRLQQAIEDRTDFKLTHPITINGQRLWIHNTAKVECKGDQIIRIAGVAQDITDQMDAKSAYKAKNEELTKINQELDQFVYKTAHDLRAPLANLVGLIGVMRNEENLDLLNSYFDLQEQSIQRLDSFIQKITTYTKNARLPLNEERVDFTLVIDDILNSLMFYDRSEQITKHVYIQPDVEFYSDKERVETIVRNLISNAIKFSDETRTDSLIEVSVEAKDSTIEIVVRDNGIGLDPSVQQRAFDMFYRGHKSADGAGIGLYIVKETVNKLHGDIKLYSKEGEFTEFKVILPNLNPLNL